MVLNKTYGVPAEWVPPTDRAAGYWIPMHQVVVPLTDEELAQRERDTIHAGEKKSAREAETLRIEALREEVRVVLRGHGLSDEAIAAWER